MRITGSIRACSACRPQPTRRSSAHDDSWTIIVAAYARPHSSRSITISDGVFASASRTPDKMAIREGERSLSYAKLAERILRVANMVHGHFALAQGERA